MEKIIQIDNDFIENETSFLELIELLKKTFSNNTTIVPIRHHHEFPNPQTSFNSTLLLMPAWNVGTDAGVKLVTVNPANSQFGLPSIQGTYIYFDSTKGTIKAIIDAKSLTARRTSAASALASYYLSRQNSSKLLMIGTGNLSTNLIRAHASVRPIKDVFIWGRNFSKAKQVSKSLQGEEFNVSAIQSIENKIQEVDIISCATLSKLPLVLGRYLKQGQHIDLVGSFKTDMREADDEAILKSKLFVDTIEGAAKESGDISTPLQQGIISLEDIQSDLVGLCSEKNSGRSSNEEITLFKSVGHALEDLTAAAYYYNKFSKKKQ